MFKSWRIHQVHFLTHVIYTCWHVWFNGFVPAEIIWCHLLVRYLGTIQWEIQKLPSQSSGEQGQREKITGFLCESKREKSSETPTRSCFQRRAKDLPGFHMVGFVGVHAKALQSWCRYTPKLHSMAFIF
jgi:hypothetical protein